MKHTLELEQYKFRVCFLYCWKNQQPKLFQKIHKIWHRGSFFTGFVHGISDKGIYHTMYFIPIVLTLFIIVAPVLFYFSPRHYFRDDMTTDSLVNGFPPPPLHEDEEQPELLQVKKKFSLKETIIW